MIHSLAKNGASEWTKVLLCENLSMSKKSSFLHSMKYYHPFSRKPTVSHQSFLSKKSFVKSFSFSPSPSSVFSFSKPLWGHWKASKCVEKWNFLLPPPCLNTEKEIFIKSVLRLYRKVSEHENFSFSSIPKFIDEFNYILPFDVWCDTNSELEEKIIDSLLELR